MPATQMHLPNLRSIRRGVNQPSVLIRPVPPRHAIHQPFSRAGQAGPMRRLLILLLPILAASPATAQDPPGCTVERAGVAACMAGKLCRCDFARGGSLTGRADGWRWDCGVLRPACGEALPPAGSGLSPLPPPEVLLHLQPPATVPRPGR
jgi:hypothetical protein